MSRRCCGGGERGLKFFFAEPDLALGVPMFRLVGCVKDLIETFVNHLFVLTRLYLFDGGRVQVELYGDST